MDIDYYLNVFSLNLAIHIKKMSAKSSDFSGTDQPSNVYGGPQHIDGDKDLASWISTA